MAFMYDCEPGASRALALAGPNTQQPWMIINKCAGTLLEVWVHPTPAPTSHQGVHVHIWTQHLCVQHLMCLIVLDVSIQLDHIQSAGISTPNRHEGGFNRKWKT
ncbi:hypothetical protein DUNSADRAFT_7131 [Dunaliella salina]|uniref:Encoded protein n=1 Tax=Dunaliella salina TaxID=3046 RepID=A0ABQ7GLY7_DUNSA|nr:hypothetical protein DUNSADRAFT_7131 [Dunaliella salina]|eukprot:KAF5835629.1 hypothetical protein DUNSADRAFT_7131 [Dunaliella salina]